MHAKVNEKEKFEVLQKDFYLIPITIKMNLTRKTIFVKI